MSETDIVLRLRHLAKLLGVGSFDIPARLNEAADEIERLRGLSQEPATFYGAQCPTYPNCSGGCGLGCTHEIEQARAARSSPETETDIVQRLRNFCVWNNRHSHYDPVPVCQEAAAEIERLRGHAPRLPERVPVKLTESAHRLWMCINGHDINDFYERAEFIINTSLDGLQVGPGNRASVKALLVEHFEQIAKAALTDTSTDRGTQ